MAPFQWFSYLRSRQKPFILRSRKGEKTKPRILLECERLEQRITPDANSAGVNGIDAPGFLNGDGIHIGQVEPGRPGLTNAPDNPANSHPDVIPVAVFLRNQAAVANSDVSAHATGVAGVMVDIGMAQNAGVSWMSSLHASAFRTVGVNPGFQHALLSMEQVARENNDDVPAINMSWGKQPGGNALNGSSLLSMGLDYLTERHNTLYVMSKGNQGVGGPVPKDSFDGLVVGSTNQVGQVFRRVRAQMDFVQGANNRRLINLIAPGQNIRVPEPTLNGLGTYNVRSGTSFAAPHATGTVALLVQDARARGLGGNAERPQVMKAILMNSVEKVQGRIGMGRTVQKRNGVDTWDQSDARDEPSLTGNPIQDGLTNLSRMMLPLDDEMGTGFLNARRADTQLRGGQFAPQNANTGAIGWDYNALATQGNINKYTLPRLRGGSWISTTLTWDRQVDLQDTNGNGLYDVGEIFINPRLSNLDLYLMPAGANNTNQALWSSISTAYNVEHIFYHLPAGNAAYEIWVRQANNIGANYGLAWWAEAAPAQQPRKVGHRVWKDLNSNGIQDAGEPSVQNVTVQLYNSTSTLLDTTTTDYYGNYQFEVSPGSYYLKFVAPAAMGFTLKGAGADNTVDSDADSTGQTSSFTISSLDNFTIDAGLVPLPYGSIGDYVWNDANNNGIQDAGEAGLAGIAVDLFVSTGDYVASTTTDSAGHYQFTSVAPGNYYAVFTAPTNYGFSPKAQGTDPTKDSDANPNGQTDVFSLALGQNKTDIDAGFALNGGSIGDYVWVDANHNGLQDADELGFSSATVNLYTSAGALFASTTTDGDGYYSFSSVPAGSYYIVVQTPSGYAFTTKNVGTSPDIDSNVNSSGQSDSFTLSLGQNITNIDAGLVSLFDASVGDYVWSDANNNGIQDAGETGISGIQVNLYKSTGTLYGTATTDGTGHYMFTGVDPGNYYLSFVSPAGSSFSPKGQGSDPTKDSDANPNGQTDVFSLGTGQSRTDIDGGLLLPSNPPVANNDSYSVLHDHTLTVGPSGVLGNDFSPGGSPLTAVLVSGGSYGTLTLTANGSFTYVPNSGFVGQDTFTYKANNGVADSNAATVTITVTNQPPMAANDTYTVVHDRTLTVAAPGVLANDSDPDGDPLSIIQLTQPSHGAFTLNSNGSFTYTANAGFVGQDNFAYALYDGANYSATASVTINVTNMPPTANTDSYTTMKNQTLTVSVPGVLGNDTDPDMDPLTAILVTTVQHGSLTLNSNGSLTYVPALNYVGPDSFQYKAFDGLAYSSATTVSITVMGGFPLFFAGNAANSAVSREVLTLDQVQPIFDEAVQRWTNLVRDRDVQDQLSNVEVRIVDLPGNLLGWTFGNVIWIDQNAAGHGWFVDVTPWDNSEFKIAVSDHELRASDASPAALKVDLLAALSHELGHVLGLQHSHAGGLMAPTLDLGVRLLPELPCPLPPPYQMPKEAIDAVFLEISSGFDVDLGDNDAGINLSTQNPLEFHHLSTNPKHRLGGNATELTVLTDAQALIN